MIKLIIFSASLLFVTLSFSQNNENVIYKYKKFQSFDFEDLVIDGETGGPGDLSIAPRFQKKFKNKLPYRKNFNAEIRKGAERIR